MRKDTNLSDVYLCLAVYFALTSSIPNSGAPPFKYSSNELKLRSRQVLTFGSLREHGPPKSANKS